MKILRYIILFTILIASVSCVPYSRGAPAQTQTLTVLAAASLTGPFNELGKLLEAQYPHTKVEFNFAGSQQLAQQLSQGAQADIFASASQKNMDAVIQAGRVAKDAPKVFAKNRLSLIYPQKNSARVAKLNDLAEPGLKLVFAAQDVPVGQYSLDFLDKASKDPAFGAAFKQQVLKNVVSYEENVKAVYTKVALGEADAGIVYLSDISPDGAEQIGSLEIPAALNVIAVYPIAAITGSKHPDLAKAYIDLVLSAAGQQVLQKYHFMPVSE